MPPRRPVVTPPGRVVTRTVEVPVPRSTWPAFRNGVGFGVGLTVTLGAVAYGIGVILGAWS